DRGFVSSGKYTTFADVLGGNVMPSGVNFVTMYPVIDRASPYPEIMVGPERVAYQNVLGNGNWSRFRYNQFRGGAKPFNVRRDEESSMYYAVTVPSTNRSELVSANAEDVVGTLALYASPNPEMMAWYPCGVIDASAVYGFAAPAFAFDGDDLVIACAVSAPDGCGVRARTAANYLSFRRVADFRARYAPQLPALGNRTRAYMATERFIMKYYRTPDGEWQSDGVLVNDLKEMYNITSAADIQIRGNRLFLLSESSRTFYALDVAGRLLSTYTGPAGIQATGMDVSADCSRALVACGANGVYEVDLSDNSWRQILAVGGNLGNPRDVAILPDGGFLVTDYQWGSHYTLRYDASATSSTVLNVDTTGYFTGATVSPSGEWGFFGRVYGGVYRVNLADNTCTTMRDNISGNPFLASYFMSCGDGKLLVSSKSGANWAYDFATGAASAPFVEHDGLSGIAIYEYVAPGFMLLFK
ncbi:MAG: hypothetical protein IJG13_03575, partial [Kiritimatiellae bacterium]|nr:hypothetical protein [Kiritimatiellia bacterium]